MAILLLDDEFMKYWLKLSIAEKESLLSVARNFVAGKTDESGMEELRKVMIQRERQQYLQEVGNSYSWEQVREMAKDKSKRDGLYSGNSSTGSS